MVLVAESVSFAYTPSRPVLRGVSAVFAPGRITAVVGPNGCGKSTLLRVLLGAAAPQTGGVALGSQPVLGFSASERARRIAYVPQSPSVAEAFTVRQVVALGRHAQRPSAEAVERALGRMDLDDRADDLFATLSAGQQQRAAIARALAQLWRESESRQEGPAATRVLLADEPLSALDPPHAVATMAALRESARDGEGMIVVVVLHDLSTARRTADDALVLGAGGGVLAAGRAHDTLTPALLQRTFGIPFAVVGGPPPAPEAVVPIAPVADTMISG